MEIYSLLIFLYLIIISALTIFSFMRLKKVRRYYIRITNNPNTLKGLPKIGFITLFFGIFSLLGIFFLSKYVALFNIIMFIASTIFYLNLWRRKCPFCKNNVKDEALICSHCGSNISKQYYEIKKIAD